MFGSMCLAAQLDIFGGDTAFVVVDKHKSHVRIGMLRYSIYGNTFASYAYS